MRFHVLRLVKAAQRQVGRRVRVWVALYVGVSEKTKFAGELSVRLTVCHGLRVRRLDEQLVGGVVIPARGPRSVAVDGGSDRRRLALPRRPHRVPRTPRKRSHFKTNRKTRSDSEMPGPVRCQLRLGFIPHNLAGEEREPLSWRWGLEHGRAFSPEPPLSPASFRDPGRRWAWIRWL